MPSRLALALFLLVFAAGCHKAERTKNHSGERNAIRYAAGLSIQRFEHYSLVKVSEPWPGASRSYTYVFTQKDAVVPDSLKAFLHVSVPVKSIVVTSTTHLPSLEMLGVETALTGFPNTPYISSTDIKKRVLQGKIRELGTNQNLNVEAVLSLNPDVVVGNGIDNHNPALDHLARAGLKVLLDGDWNEKDPLGRAEWIKFFGELFGKPQRADAVFNAIEKRYIALKDRASGLKVKPAVLTGTLFENVWYVPQGDSWAARIISHAGGRSPWANEKGTGSLKLSFEAVFSKAANAPFWIGPDSFTSLEQMEQANPHYAQFRSFRNKQVYSFAKRRGATGGLLYYELAPNRPDLVLEDYVAILHPDLLPEHRFHFFNKL